MSKQGTRYVSVQQAARELKISGRAVRHRIKAGTLPAIRIGDGYTSAYAIEVADLARAKAETKAAS